tara:strand:+ start:315 stop:1685 length:1371 start_codon:yes stop_codon:yes gene_type:complete
MGSKKIASELNYRIISLAKDPKKGTGKKPKGSKRRLYTDENPKDTVPVKFRTVSDIKETLSRKDFKSKSHARQSQIINLIHQRVRAAYQNAKDPKVKARLKKALKYAESRKKKSKEKTKRLKKSKSKLNNLYDYLVKASLFKEADDILKIINAAYEPPPEVVERERQREEELKQKRQDESASIIEAIMEHSPSMFASEPEYLTSGTEAHVFRSGEKILKITKSHGEAGIASAVKSAPYRGIYNVYEVYKVGSQWAIVVEFLGQQDSDMYAAGSVVWEAVDGKKGANAKSRNFVFNSDLKFVDAIERVISLVESAGGLEYPNDWSSTPTVLSDLTEEESRAFRMASRANGGLSPAKGRLRGTEEKTRKGYSGGRQVDVSYLEMGYLDYLDAIKVATPTLHLQDLKDHLKYIYDTFGVQLTDISGGNYGSRDGKIVLLDLGYSSGVTAQDYVDLSDKI